MELDLQRSPLAQERARAVLDAHAAEEQSRSVPADVLERMSSWYAAAILELARCEDYEPDPNWIAATLVPRITPDQAREALQDLREAGLLDEDFEVPDQPIDVSSPMMLPMGELSAYALKFHASALRLGADAIGEFNASERLVRGACAALSQEAVQRFLPRLQELALEMIHASQADPDPPNRVHIMSVAFFPVSLYTDTEYDPEELIDDDQGR